MQHYERAAPGSKQGLWKLLLKCKRTGGAIFVTAMANVNLGMQYDTWYVFSIRCQGCRYAVPGTAAAVVLIIRLVLVLPTSTYPGTYHIIHYFFSSANTDSSIPGI